MSEPEIEQTEAAVPAVGGITEPLLATEQLVKEYRHRRVVNGVSITVAPGEIVGLLGPNGAGKTTTFNIVVGLIKPDSGAVLFQQRNMTRLPMHQRARLGIGYLTQEPSVFRKLSVEQNILAILETCRMKRALRAVRLKYLLQELDLTALAKSMATNNSPLPRNTVAKKRSSRCPMRSRTTPMNHRNAIPANGTMLTARATVLDLEFSHDPGS